MSPRKVGGARGPLSHRIYYASSIALIIHSLDLSLSSRLIAIRSVDPTLGLTKGGAQCAPYGIAQERNGVFKKIGISIALLQKAGGRGIPIAVAIHSFDPTLQKGLIT